METAEPTVRRKPGRPASFDRDTAVHQAMLLFWRHGYEATSLTDLTHAMGVTPPSIYAAFGDKKGLFRAAVARYTGGPVTSASLIADAADGYAAARALLEGSVIAFTGAATPRGCLLASAAISCSEAAADVQAELAGIRKAIEADLRRKIARDIASGALPDEVPASALAAQVMATIQGLSTLARDGASRAKLQGVAAVALRAWPGAGRQR